ncbi:MAG: hypothetical protein PF636_10140 [Actinomycetota bacterium]|jgi:hypothetical protein|nr:hypothetical protein [Actinomycetota bacterium]
MTLELTPIVIDDDHYFTIAEFRAHVSNLSPNVTDAEIEDLRDHIEGVFEDAAGRAFIVREKSERLRGDGTATYLLGEYDACELVSVTVDSVAIADALVDEAGMLEMPAAVAVNAAILVTYTYGLDPAPRQLKRLALLAAESMVGSSSIDARATGQQSEFGYIKYSVAGRDGAFGIPEVDAFLSRDPKMGGYGVRRHVIA